MKHLLWIILFIPNLLSAQQQQTPQFQTTIYFEDTLGHKDSIIIGYDENETQNFINPNFGEVDITNVPWDSIFEVRVMPAIGNDVKQSKKQIECYMCDNTTSNYNWIVFTIGVRLKISYSPLIIRWESTDFSSDLCRTGSLIVESPQFFSVPNPTIQGYSEVYMMNGSTYGTYWGAGGHGHGFFATDESGNQVLINALMISIAKNYPVSTYEQELQSQTKVFPNPMTDNFTIELPENYLSESIHVFDVTGREIYGNIEKSNQINISSSTWAKGIYFYQVKLENGIIVNGKVVKAE
jgi:hypothetical protein